jgi:hypothetical protein
MKELGGGVGKKTLTPFLPRFNPLKRHSSSKMTIPCKFQRTGSNYTDTSCWTIFYQSPLLYEIPNVKSQNAANPEKSATMWLSEPHPIPLASAGHRGGKFSPPLSVVSACCPAKGATGIGWDSWSHFAADWFGLAAFGDLAFGFSYHNVEFWKIHFFQLWNQKSSIEPVLKKKYPSKVIRHEGIKPHNHTHSTEWPVGSAASDLRRSPSVLNPAKRRFSMTSSLGAPAAEIIPFTSGVSRKSNHFATTMPRTSIVDFFKSRKK